MLKGNDTELSDAENILFGPKYEELVGKSLSSKNRSKELFGSIKTQGLSKEGSRRQPFQKSPIFRSRRYERRGTFTAAGQTLQQQYPTGEQGRGKNEFIDSTFHQLDEPSFCIRILQNTSTSSEFTSGKNQATAQSRQSETFCKELAKTDKRSYDTGYSKRLRNFFYSAAKAILATKCVSVNQRSIKPSGSGGLRHVEERCYGSFGSQREPISQLFVFCEKERWGGGESPSSQPKGPEQKYSVSARQDGRVVPIKGNVVTWGQNVQDRPEGCLLFAIFLSVKSRKYVRFHWKDLLYEFCCLYFGLSPAPPVFTKLLKVPISLLRKFNVRIVIYLDDMLLMVSSLEDLLVARDTLIFILQHLGFLINVKDSCLEPKSTLEFLGVIVDSGEMTLSLP